MSDENISNTLAIIPARGGSKGLPRKNVLPLGDAPLIAHTIRAALESRIERVIVSTDDEEIAGVSRDAGAEAPFLRPAALSGDSATSLSVLIHALDYVEKEQGAPVEHVVYLQPTSPFRDARHINEALDIYLGSDFVSVISVADVQEFHPYFMFRQEEGHQLKPLFEMEDRPLRRQDLPSFYRINGALYITRRGYFRGIEPSAAIFDWNSLGSYAMDAPSSIDINDYVDFQRAELLLKERL